MVPNTLVKATNMVAFSALPLAAAVVFAGPSSAETAPQQATPVAGIPLEKSHDITTKPNSVVPDPVLNGSSVGGSIGSGLGSATGCATGLGSAAGSAGSALGGLIGALVGYFDPEAIPQALP